jgi:hypothetical protein
MLGAAQQGVGNLSNMASLRSRDADRLSYETNADFGATLAELAGEAYDMYKTRTTTKTDPARGGSWG